jgi:regulator of protease activity HflC (stomatin/prohibitin superfamily)
LADNEIHLLEEGHGEMKIAGAIACGIIGLLGILTLLECWYTVDQGERGVKLFNGAYAGTVQPGLGFKLPWVESVQKIDVRTQTFKWIGDTAMTGVLSADQQPATIEISVTYHPDQSRVEEIYSRYGTADALASRVLYPHANQAVHVTFGGYNAIEAINKQGQLNADIQAELVRQVLNDPLVIESVQIENVKFSDQYINAVEARMQAEVQVQQLEQQKAQQEVQAQITVVNAKAAADAVRAQAQAEADATLYKAQAAAKAVVLRGQAEAQAIKARGDALRDNPNIVFLTTAERWDGKLPDSMIPGGALPMLSLPSQK